MGLARDWSRQTARAAGVSLIAPLALLGAAAVVAFGGGLGGLGSLRQIASGPALPQTDLAATPGTGSLGRAQVVALALDDAGRAAGGAGAAPSGSPRSGTGSSGSAPAQNPAGPPNGSVGGGGSAPTPGTGPPSRTPGGSAPAPPAAAAPVAPAPAPAPAPPVGQVLEAPRDLGESLPAPVGAPVDGGLDPLLGPRR